MKTSSSCRFGLIGLPLSHSWSPCIYSELFRENNVSGTTYQLFPLQDLSELPALILENNDLCGLNVTIPYKEKIIPLLDELDNTAIEIGAVNTIKVSRERGKIRLKGYNTDFPAFAQSADFTGYSHAFILGTGGGSRAVAHALKIAGIPFTLVSRNPVKNISIGYSDLAFEDLPKPFLIINTTPSGMIPDVLSCPDIPYERLSADTFLYDLVYNPEQTLFLKKGADRGCKTQNGMKMLRLQAEKSCEIWGIKPS